MSLFTRQVIMACTILLATALLAGCSQSGDVAPDPTLTPDTGASVEPQSLIIWHGLPAPEHEALQRIADRFTESRPDIDIQIDAHDPSTLLLEFETAVLSGSGPDILLAPSSWIAPLAEKGIIQPASPELTEMMNNTLPLPLAQSTQITDTPYGIPYSADFATLYTNRTLVDESPQIWDHLAPAARQSGLIITPDFQAISGLYFTPGNQFVSADGTLLATRYAVESFLSELQTLADEPGITFTEDVTSFSQGQVGMLLASSSHYAALQTALGEDLSVAVLPRVPPRQWSTLVEFGVLVQNLNTTVEATQATNAFAEYFLSPDVQRIWFEDTGHAPVNPAGLINTSLRAAWASTLEWATSAPLNARFEAEIRPALDRAVHAVTSGSQNVEGATASIMATLESGGPP